MLPPRYPIRLGVNIDHCATLRQARYRDYSRSCGKMVEPDPIACALTAERAGAEGITIHLREDRRHIQESDAYRLRECIQTHLNLEMSATEAMATFAKKLAPEAVCIVPENREEVTTEGGLDVINNQERIEAIVTSLQMSNINVSLFIEPNKEQIEAAATIGCKAVELHTGAWANAFYDRAQCEVTYQCLCEGAELSHQLGLAVHAGHGINYHNARLICELPHLQEVNIGHSIISRALLDGFYLAVRDMKGILANCGK